MARGGARPGAGRPKKPLAEKILEGNRSRKKITKLIFDTKDMKGSDMPEVSEYLKQKTKNTTTNIAPVVFKETWKWLKERKCDNLIKKELLEQYSIGIARWIQCEEGISRFGLLAKHPTTNMPIASPYVSMGVTFLKQANVIWGQIFQIVKENCQEPVNNNPNDDIMEKILTGRL